MKIEKSVTVAAPPEVVWRALVDAEELRRWFAVDAKVEPGPGGSVWLSWGPGAEGSSQIEIWEPGKRLSVVQSYGGDPPVLITVEYQLEGAGGSTVLRLVHSGFSGDWESQFDALDGGWTNFLFTLKHYLERHRGVPRVLIWERRRLAAPREQVWEALTGPGGLARTGERLVLRLDGEEVAGRVFLDRPPNHLGALLPGLDDALLFLELEGGSPSAWHCGSYLSTYGLPQARVAALRRSFPALLDRVLRPFEAAPV